MATTISRFTWTDDSGTPSAPAGNGTTINNAQLQAIWDEVDAVLAGNVLFGGTVSSEGFGAHEFSAGGTGANALLVRNTSAGTGNYAEVRIGNNGDALATRLVMHSSTFTTSGAFVQDGFLIVCNRTWCSP